MIRDLLLALGLVAIVEGLALALAPLHFRKALETMVGWISGRGLKLGCLRLEMPLRVGGQL